MKQFFFYTFIIFFTSGALLARAQAVDFTRTLKQGDQGGDVLLLQQLLNKDKDTAIAVSGDGSAGFETTYFGRLTKQAVIRFQTKYKYEVLTPAGVSTPTGIAGAFTRAKLKALSLIVANPSPLPPVAPAPVTPPVVIAPPQPAGQAPVALFGAYPQNAKVGEKVSLLGVGFSLTKNYVKIGGTVIEAVASGPETLDFTMPALEAGKYPVTVSLASNGTPSEPAYVMVYKTNAIKPTITSVTPDGALIDTEFVIHGSGFDSVGNSVHTLGGTIENLSSPDGATLSFYFKNVPNFLLLRQALVNTGATFAVPVYVENLNGFSDQMFVNVNLQNN